MLTGLAHTAICVPDVEAACRWYTDVLGLRVLSPPYRMEGAEIEADMGELVPSPVVVTAAIVGFGNGRPRHRAHRVSGGRRRTDRSRVGPA